MPRHFIWLTEQEKAFLVLAIPLDFFFTVI